MSNFPVIRQAVDYMVKLRALLAFLLGMCDHMSKQRLLAHVLVSNYLLTKALAFTSATSLTHTCQM